MADANKILADMARTRAELADLMAKAQDESTARYAKRKANAWRKKAARAREQAESFRV